MFPASVDRPAHTITVHLADLTVPDDQPISTELNQPAKKVELSPSHFGPEQTNCDHLVTTLMKLEGAGLTTSTDDLSLPLNLERKV